MIYLVFLLNLIVLLISRNWYYGILVKVTSLIIFISVVLIAVKEYINFLNDSYYASFIVKYSLIVGGFLSIIVSILNLVLLIKIIFASSGLGFIITIFNPRFVVPFLNIYFAYSYFKNLDK
jgi:hypothetical protein